MAGVCCSCHPCGALLGESLPRGLCLNNKLRHVRGQGERQGCRTVREGAGGIFQLPPGRVLSALGWPTWQAQHLHECSLARTWSVGQRWGSKQSRYFILKGRKSVSTKVICPFLLLLPTEFTLIRSPWPLITPQPWKRGLREQRSGCLLKVRSQISMTRFKLRSTGSHLLRPHHLLKVHTFSSGVKSEVGGKY